MRIFKKELTWVFLAGLIGVYTPLFLGESINIDKDLWYWTFSTIFQGFAALFGLLGIFVVYKFQVINNKIDTLRKSICNNIGEELPTEAIEQRVRGMTQQRPQVGMWVAEIKKLENQKSSSLGSILNTLAVISALMVLSIVLLPVFNISESAAWPLIFIKERGIETMFAMIGMSASAVLLVVMNMLKLLKGT